MILRNPRGLNPDKYTYLDKREAIKLMAGSRSHFYGSGGSTPRDQLISLLSDGHTVVWYQPPIPSLLGASDVLTASKWVNWVNATAGTAGDLLQAGAASTQPIIVSSSYRPRLVNFGSTSNWITTPSSPAVQLTSEDSDIRAHLMIVDTTADFSVWIKDNAVGTPAEYMFYHIGATKKLRFKWRGAGGAHNDDSSSINPIGNGVEGWIRKVRTRSTGDVIFYTSTDTTNDDTAVTWTKLGNTISGTAEDCIAASNPVSISGNQAFAASSANGRLFRVVMYKNGVKTADSNAEDSPETSVNGATWTSSTTGEVYTLVNTGATPAQIARNPSLIGDGTARFMQTGALSIPAPYVWYWVFSTNAWTSDTLLFDGRSADYEFSAQQFTGSPQIRLHDSVPSSSGTVSPTLSTWHILTTKQDAGGNWSIQLDGNTPVIGTGGAITMTGITLMRKALTAGGYGAFQIKEGIGRTIYTSAAQDAQVQSLLRSIHGTP